MNDLWFRNEEASFFFGGGLLIVIDVYSMYKLRHEVIVMTMTIDK